MQLEIRTDLVGTDEMEETRDEQTIEMHAAVDTGCLLYTSQGLGQARTLARRLYKKRSAAS